MKSFAAVLLLGVAAAGAGFAAGAMAQDNAKVVSERQALMKQQGRELVAVRNYLQGKGDEAAALSALDNLKKSVPTIADRFPPGTGIGEISVKTRAKPEIWREHDAFLADEKKVAAQIAVLDAAVRSGDKAKAEVAFKDLDGCNACHNTFRAKAR